MITVLKKNPALAIRDYLGSNLKITKVFNKLLHANKLNDCVINIQAL